MTYLPTMSKSKFIFFFIAIFLFLYKIHPVNHFDTYFGLAIGKYIVEHRSLPWHEVFSWAAQGRAWVPYEWLAQTIVYLLYWMGGLTAISLWVAFLYTLFFMLTFFLFHKAIGRKWLSSLLLALFTTASVYEFFVARPQAIAYTSFMATLFLIYYKNSRLLWLSIPITYLWTNSHASFILAPFLFFSYGFFRFGILNVLVTLLPPLWYKPYLLLWEFFQDLPFISSFVSEWKGLDQNLTYQWFLMALIALSTLASLVRRKISLPLIFLMLSSLTAIRHVPIGTIAAIVNLGLTIPELKFKKVFNAFIILFVITLSAFLLYQKKLPISDTLWILPSSSIEQDIQNIKNMNLQGHMFNEYAVGGFLIHALYPSYQVFFDGRADIYHNHELRDFWPLIANKKASSDEFLATVNNFLNTYQFSYIIIPIFSYNPLEHTATSRMADLLLDTPDWRLVYASDHIEILIRNDGKNQARWDQGFTSITPYRLTAFRSGKNQQALNEYQQLLKLKDSGIARNGLGQVYISLGKTEEARREFEKSVNLNERLGEPLIGLRMYEQAIKVTPYLGESYLLLAQIYIDANKPKQAVSILEQGLKQDIDFISRQKIVQMLNEFSRGSK